MGIPSGKMHLLRKWVMSALLLKSSVQMKKQPWVGIKLRITLSLTWKWNLLERHDGLRMATRPLTPQHQALLVWCLAIAYKFSWLMPLCLGFLCSELTFAMHTFKPQAQRNTSSFVAKFGIENEGCIALIWQALYGGKVAGRDFWHHLRDWMGQLGFSSSCADPDVWLRLLKQSTREEY